MASDEKPTKAVARVMMGMTREINERLRAEVGKPADEVTAVTCMTCHRGSAIPTIATAAAN